MPDTDIVISGIGWYLLCSKVVLSGHSVRPGWQAGLMIGWGGAFFLRKTFKIADSQYQLCPYFELPNYQNLVSVGCSALS